MITEAFYLIKSAYGYYPEFIESRTSINSFFMPYI